MYILIPNVLTVETVTCSRSKHNTNAEGAKINSGNQCHVRAKFISLATIVFKQFKLFKHLFKTYVAIRYRCLALDDAFLLSYHFQTKPELSMT